ncbi:CesT family type III secretion system chaperone [Algicola sagamiensis]|uniref:CesT family type III secretion system chaperone n=1 Tax=Algicola sagamiensis TaxID=163869 RepID=UPI00037C361F|nr:CesT family type III secretion system chaperone [Algicola sagamiensis]
MENLIQEWLKENHPDLSLNDGVCNLVQSDLDVELSLYYTSKNNQLTLLSPFHMMNGRDYNLMLERALIDNADAEKMDGCWISLIENQLVLSHSRELNDLDQVGLTNLVSHFISKSYLLRQEYDAQTLPDDRPKFPTSGGILA